MKSFDIDEPEGVDLDYFSITPTDLLAEESDRTRLQGGHTLNDYGHLQADVGIKQRKDHK